VEFPFNLHISSHEQRFSLVVENDVEESVSQTHFFQVGHALDNIRERLHLIYGALASIEVTMPQPNFVSVRIEAPVGQAQHGRKS
jgi:hypothetical protein